MILPWTSSVNNNVIQSVNPTVDSNRTYEDLMVAHVWNLYTNLSSSGWQTVSASFYDASSDVYTVGTSWTGSSNIKFPLSMSLQSQEEILINRQKNIESNTDTPYTPTPHSWVTLRSSSFNDGNYFLTIDCRYPLPLHSSSTGVIIERRDKLLTTTSISSIKSIQTSNGKIEKKYFAGPSGVYKDLDYAAIDSDGVGGDDKVSGYLNKQDINPFNGVSFHSDEIVEYDNVNIQDFPSRTVTFIDLVFHKANNLLKEDGNTFKSMTTSVRPKTDTLDSNSWYVCWGLDFFELENGTSFVANKNTKLNDITKYKYAFHHANGNFIYQIYKNVDATFNSAIGFLPIYNSNSSENIKNTSFCINCNPANYYSNGCINFNTTGKKINLVAGNSIVEFNNNLVSYLNNKDNDQLNNFYNTCFRNYNFSDGIVSIKAGDGNYVGKRSNLPIFAPTSPKHSSIMMDEQPFISSSFSSIAGQQFFISEPSTTTIHEGADTNKIMLPNSFKTSIPSSNINYFKQNFDKYVIKPDKLLSTLTSDYVQTEFCFTIGEDGNKKILMENGGEKIFNKRIKLNNIQSNTGEITPYVFFRESFTDINVPSDINASNYLNIFDEEMFSPEYNVSYNGKPKIGTKYIVVKLADDGSKFSLPSLKFFNSTLSKPTALGKLVISSEILNTIKRLNGGLTSLVSSAATNASILNSYFYVNTTYTATTSIITPITTNFSWPATGVYALVDISEIYNVNNSNPYLGNVIPQFGNFNYSAESANLKKSQEKGINYFSVFKSKEPLASTLFTFAKSTEELSDKSVFGTINKAESETDSRYLVGKDSYNSYSELPTFLFSAVNSSNKLKGYVPDLTLAPQSIEEGTVIKDTTAPTGTVKYKKVFWGGMWFPWVSSEAPELG